MERDKKKVSRFSPPDTGMPIEGRPAPHIPDHELLRRVGMGSYGEVWLARNVMGSYRAVKVVYRSAFEQKRPCEREFEGIRKFEPVSRRHESQVDILLTNRLWIDFSETNRGAWTRSLSSCQLIFTNQEFVLRGPNTPRSYALSASLFGENFGIEDGRRLELSAKVVRAQHAPALLCFWVNEADHQERRQDPASVRMRGFCSRSIPPEALTYGIWPK